MFNKNRYSLGEKVILDLGSGADKMAEVIAKKRGQTKIRWKYSKDGNVYFASGWFKNKFIKKQTK